MLKELKIHHREIARLSFEGFKPAEIAERTSAKLQNVYNVLRDPLCKSYVAGLSDRADKVVLNVREKLADMNVDALDTISNLINPMLSDEVPPSVQLNAAKDVLDRNGYKPAEKHEHLHGHFTSDDLTELRKRASSVERIVG